MSCCTTEKGRDKAGPAEEIQGPVETTTAVGWASEEARVLGVGVVAVVGGGAIGVGEEGANGTQLVISTMLSA